MAFATTFAGGLVATSGLVTTSGLVATLGLVTASGEFSATRCAVPAEGSARSATEVMGRSPRSLW